jgi:hypothetical protein
VTRARTVCAALPIVAALLSGGCRDLEVVTNTHATLDEARRAGAVERGWVPQWLPPGAREIREAHDLDTNRRWGLFNFPSDDVASLRSALGPEIEIDGQRVDAPRRIEWWPIILRGLLDGDQIALTGLKAHARPDEGLTVVVNWRQGRAYYFTPAR